MTYIFTGAVAALTLSIGAAFAAPLAPGGTVGLSGVTFADPVHGGTQGVINDNLIAFTLDPTPTIAVHSVNGLVQNRVTELASGFLNFAPRIRDTTNNDSVIFSITEMIISGYGTFDTFVEFKTDGLGDVGPDSASRSADGNDITLSYGTPIVIGNLFGQPRHSSFFPSIVTDATAFALTGSATISGFISDLDGVQTGDAFSTTITGLAVPVSPVPLPASILLLGAGLAGLGLSRRHK